MFRLGGDGCLNQVCEISEEIIDVIYIRVLKQIYDFNSESVQVFYPTNYLEYFVNSEMT